MGQRECQVCGNVENNVPYTFREMMFGRRERFEYFECGACGCLQIVEPPENIADYYPETYYSLNLTKGQVTADPAWLRFVKAHRLNSYLGNKDPLGKLFRRVFGDAWFSEIEMKYVSLRADYRILDIGCGDGHRLQRWARHGFIRLDGIDPFIQSDTSFGNGVRLFKCGLTEFSGTYDFIMAHHSLEHMWDQQGMVNAIARLLKPERYAEICLPLAESDAWKKYRENWVCIEAPRHFFLHTFRSLGLLIERAGLEIVKIVHDSTSKEIWASKQYEMDIPLLDERSHEVNPENSPFSQQDIEQFEREVQELNRQGRSQQARFFIYKPKQKIDAAA